MANEIIKNKNYHYTHVKMVPHNLAVRYILYSK